MSDEKKTETSTSPFRIVGAVALVIILALSVAIYNDVIVYGPLGWRVNVQQ